jgi:hypothetical protein
MNNDIEENNETMQSQAPYYTQDRSLPNGTATLVLGILSIVICGPGLIMGIIAIILHKKDKAIYYKNKVAYDQAYKTARAGYICAIIGTSLSALMVVFYILYFAFIFSVAFASGDSNLFSV